MLLGKFSAIYGPPSPLFKADFWDCLNTLGSTFTGPWMVIGDFNFVLNYADKRGVSLMATSSGGGLRKVVDNHGFIDLSFVGNAYTWTNRLRGAADIWEQIVRGFANVRWKLMFPSTTILHMTAISYDHKPLLLDTHPTIEPSPKPFCLKECGPSTLKPV